MIRIKVTKNNVITNFADFATQELADTWKNENISANIFGKPERWLAESEFQDETIESSIETSQENRLGVMVNVYKFAAEYSISQEDVTAIYATQQLIKKGQDDAAFGSYIAKKIWILAGSKNLTNEQIDGLYTDPVILKIREMLLDGSLKTSRRNLASADLSLILTQGEKDAVLAELDAYIE
jgi:hypothetical protein